VRICDSCGGSLSAGEGFVIYMSFAADEDARKKRPVFCANCTLTFGSANRLIQRLQRAWFDCFLVVGYCYHRCLIEGGGNLWQADFGF
jgi:hypothetical protein